MKQVRAGRQVSVCTQADRMSSLTLGPLLGLVIYSSARHTQDRVHS